MPFDVEKTMVFKAYHTYRLVKNMAGLTHIAHIKLPSENFLKKESYILLNILRIEWVKNGIFEEALHFSVMARGHAVPRSICVLK